MWCGKDYDIPTHREELASDVAQARARHDPETASVYMGQGVGQVQSIRPAAAVVREICHSAENILRQLPQKFAPAP